MFNRLSKTDAISVRKVFRLKGTSKFTKPELVFLLNCNLAAIIIQRSYRNYKLSSKICPFTLETPYTPYYKKDTVYYTLDNLIGYLNSNRNWCCPITRQQFSQTDIKNINSMAKLCGLPKIKKPKIIDPIVENTRNMMDSVVGDLIFLIEDPTLTHKQMNTVVHSRIIPSIVPAFAILRRSDKNAAENFIQQALGVFNKLLNTMNIHSELEKCHTATLVILSLNEYANTYGVRRRRVDPR